ncbi:MAG: transposase, partial [Methylobacter sp.]
AWLNHSRRLSKTYERLVRTDETWIYIAMTRIMLNRLA